MQTTEIKKDYRQERTALNRRLQQYYAAYLQAAWEWLEEFTANLSNITDDRLGWARIHPDIEDQLREQFSDLWDIQRPYSPAPKEVCAIWRTFYSKQIKPINETLDDHVKSWWDYAWRLYRINFNAVLPAPQPIPPQFKKINARTYQLGQITVQIGSEKQWREVQFMTPDETVLSTRRCHRMTINECLPVALSIAKRIAHLGDWAQYSCMPFSGQVALKEKLKIVVAYYEEDYWEYKKRRKQFHLWKPEEELQAVLQAEKDRHAPHR